MTDLNIAYLGNQLTQGGGATSLYLMLHSLKQSKHRKYVWLTEIRSKAMQRDLQAFCEEVELIGLDDLTSCQTKRASVQRMKKVVGQARGADLLIRKLRECNIDVLHVNNAVFSHLYERIKAETDVKIITHVREWITHEGTGPTERFILDRIGRHSDAVIAISPVEAQMFNGFEKLHILPNPFDFGKLPEAGAENPSPFPPVPEGKVLIGMIGRPSLSKGHMKFIEVLEYMVEKGADPAAFKMMMIGLSRPPNHWRKLAKRLLGREPYFQVMRRIQRSGRRNQVVVMPYQTDILPVVQNLDIVVRPSLYADPWGRDIIEAMALRKPVVAFGESGFFIRHGENGFLVPGLSSEQMANRLLFLLENPDLRKEMGEAGFQRVRAMCDLDTYGERISNIYDDMTIHSPRSR